MAWFLVWLRRLVVAVLLFNLGQLLLPEGEIRRPARMVLGLLVVLVLIPPLASFPWPDFADLVSLRSGGASVTTPPLQAAEQIATAGLEAWRATAEAETIRAVREFCWKELGLAAAVEIKRAGEKAVVLIHISSAAEAEEVREAVARQFGWPSTAVEVMVDGR